MLVEQSTRTTVRGKKRNLKRWQVLQPTVQFFWVWVLLGGLLPPGEADFTPGTPAPPWQSATWPAGAAGWMPTAERRCGGRHAIVLSAAVVSPWSRQK